MEWEQISANSIGNFTRIDAHRKWHIYLLVEDQKVEAMAVTHDENGITYRYEVTRVIPSFIDSAKTFIDTLENPEPDNFELKRTIEMYICAKHKLDQLTLQEAQARIALREAASKLIDACVEGTPDSLVYPLESGYYAVIQFDWEEGNVSCNIIEGVK